jgi:hypothetical protein
MRRLFSGFVLSALLAAESTSYGAVVNVTTLAPAPAPGVWGTNLAGAGTADIVNLTGEGGNLENNQPLPVGAVKLTTGPNNPDRAEAGIQGNFGLASAVLNNLAAGYSYFKVAQGNLTAAPSLKLSVFALGGTGDNFGQLIFEPNWNQGIDASVLPPSGDWQQVVIDENTGSGGTGGGGWWWSGGFEQPSGGGGPPVRSAAEWAALFASSDPTDFANAIITEIRVGVGTFNQDQVGYFDAVVFGDTTWNFEPQAAVPEPASMALWGFGALGLACYRARRKRAANHA